MVYNDLKEYVLTLTPRQKALLLDMVKDGGVIAGTPRSNATYSAEEYQGDDLRSFGSAGGVIGNLRKHPFVNPQTKEKQPIIVPVETVQVKSANRTKYQNKFDVNTNLISDEKLVEYLGAPGKEIVPKQHRYKEKNDKRRKDKSKN